MKRSDLKIGDHVKFSFIKVEKNGIAQELTWQASIIGFYTNDEHGEMLIVTSGFHFPLSWVQSVLISKACL